MCCKSQKSEVTAPPTGQTSYLQAKEMNMTNERKRAFNPGRTDEHSCSILFRLDDPSLWIMQLFGTVFWYCGVSFLFIPFYTIHSLLFIIMSIYVNSNTYMIT